MNKIFKIFLIIFFLTITDIHISFTSIKNNIIAKVGNEIITLIELENKINTTLTLANQKINQENIDKLKNISLKKLIDLKIKQNEIKNFNLTINNLAIDNHMQRVSDNLNVDPANLKKFFKLNKINYNQYENEVKIEFLWQKLITQLYSSKINIKEDQIKNEINEILNKKEKIIEFKLAELEVNFENENRDELIKEVKNSIKDIGFSKTIIKYSISPSALNEGEIGWINSEDISSSLLKKIENLKIGEISNEIEVSKSLVFYKMLDKKINDKTSKMNIDEIRQNIINKKKNELLNLYSNSHLSIKKNNTLIKLQ